MNTHKTISILALLSSVIANGAVNFAPFPNFVTTTTGTATTATVWEGTTTFTYDVSLATGYVRASYTGAYDGVIETGINDNTFQQGINASVDANEFVARNGVWEISFFEDAALTTPAIISGFTIGLMHLNDLNGSRYIDYFHEFSVNGFEVQPNLTSSVIAGNHVYDPVVNAVGGSNTGDTFEGVSVLAFDDPVSVFTMVAGASEADASFAGTPSGNTFDVDPTPGYGTIGVDFNSLSGTAVIPEPSSLLLCFIGTFGLISRRNRK